MVIIEGINVDIERALSNVDEIVLNNAIDINDFF